MASIAVSTFADAAVTNDDGDYIDITYIDRSPKAIRRAWRFTYIKQEHDRSEGRACYATLDRSATDDGAFNVSIESVPQKIVAALMAAAIRDEIIPLERPHEN